jgi:hypothetical protein
MKRFYVITIVVCLLLMVLYACGLSIEQKQGSEAQTAVYSAES